MTRSHWLPIVLVLCAVFIPYAASIGNERIGDDRDLIINRLGPEQVTSAAQLWEENYWGSYLDSGLYRPIPLTLLYAQRLAFGLVAWPYRVVNLVLYAASGMLCFLFLGMIAGRTAALAGAALFLLHPAHVEVVITAYGQAEMLAAAFVLVALIAHVRAGRGGNLNWNLLSLGAFFAAMLCKEVAVSFPLLAILTRGFWITPDAKGWRRWIAPSDLSFGLVIVLYAAVKLAAIGMLTVPATASAMAGLPVGKKIYALLGVGLGNYIRLSLFPVSQSMLYDVFPNGQRDALWVLGGILFAGLSARLVGAAKTAFALAWFFATWFIFSNLVVPTGVYVAERCLFLPLLGLCFLFGIYVEHALVKGQKVLIAALSAVLILAAAQSARTAWEWRTEESSLRASVQQRPYSPMARANLALALLITPQLEQRPATQGELSESENLLVSLVRDYPNLPEAHRGLGILAMTRGDYPSAIENLRRGLALRPLDTILQADLAHCERMLRGAR